MSEIEHIEKQIITVLEKIRPFLNRDGGDVEFVAYKDGEVFVRMIGACAGCDLIDSTLQDGIATLLKEEVPGVVKVTNVIEVNDSVVVEENQ
jgi:Fe-S cluster biogenesis protein NfuA